MKQIWLLLWAEAAGWNWKKNILWMAVLIILMVSTVSYVKKQEAPTEKISLGVSNEDTSEYAALLLSYFNENETFLRYVELTEAAEEKLRASLLQGTMDGYLVIPADFATNMIQMENLPIIGAVSMKHPARALILRHAMEAYERYIEAVEVNCTALYRIMKEEGFDKELVDAANVDISMELIFTALGKDEMFRLRKVETEEPVSMAEYYKTMGIYFILVFSLLFAGLRIRRMKKDGLTDRLVSMNVPEGTVYLTVLLPQMLLIFLVEFLLCLQKDIWSVQRVLCGVLTFLPWIILVILLGKYVVSEQQYMFLMSIFMVGTAIIGGSLIPVQFLPEIFQKIAEWMPNQLFTELFTGVPEGGSVL